MPLDVCGAESQGMIGYMLQRTLRNKFRALGILREVVSVVTQVLVRRDDPAFSSPTKPVGPFYTAARAERVSSLRGYIMREDAGRGWRRVVASPDPQEIVESESIRCLVENGCVVIASGGGGIPVALDDGVLMGVEAVIDKDLAAERLATGLGAQTLLILTDVERVALDFGKPSQRSLDRVTATQMRQYMRENHFKPGSMLPKVEACVRFVAAGGKEAIVTSLDRAFDALSGAGTHIVPPSD
jgi:carbamate kinase